MFITARFTYHTYRTLRLARRFLKASGFVAHSKEKYLTFKRFFFPEILLKSHFKKMDASAHTHKKKPKPSTVPHVT